MITTSTRVEDADIAGLLERVEKAAGPDREIDYDIARFEGWTQHTDEGEPVFVGKVSTWWAEPGCEWSTTSKPPAYTTSIDAAVSFAEGIAHKHGRKIICFFCAGGQLVSDKADPNDADYDIRAKIDTSVTVGWLSHVAFFEPGSSATYGPERYSHGRTAALAIIEATLVALIERDRSLSQGAGHEQ